MKLKEAIKYVQRTNSFKMGDAVKRLTSKKINTGIDTPDMGDPARRGNVEDRKQKRKRMRRERLHGQVKNEYNAERGYVGSGLPKNNY
jgi:hypothetical protein